MRCPTLTELPPPPKRTGWPWAEESQQLPDTMPDGSPCPCVSIVTLEGVMVASPGDWIIKGIKGEFYPCKPDIFDGLFKDHSIDIRTGELLGRYIAEERDTARLLRSCYEQLAAAGNDTPQRSSEALTSLEDKVDTLCRAVDELRQIVCAQAMPANGRKTARTAASTD